MKKTERSKPSAGRTSRASYRRHPMSLVQRIAVTASAVITFAILVALLAYILIMGVPNLKPDAPLPPSPMAFRMAVMAETFQSPSPP